MQEVDYAKHIMEIAERHALDINPNDVVNIIPCSGGLTQAIYRPSAEWCVKLHEPGSMDDGKLRAERAAINIVSDLLPVPRILGFGITDAIPSRSYQVMEWKDGRAWSDVVHRIDPDEHIGLLSHAGALLGILHSIRLPEVGDIPDIPHGNYQTWRSRNLPILDENLAFLPDHGLLRKEHVERVKSAIAIARDRLFQSALALTHGDFSGGNLSVWDSS